MPKFSIGNVVSFSTHPFIATTADIVISGEHLMLPPMMVIIEVTDHEPFLSESAYQNKYTCLWYSTKQNKFKEDNFIESDLKLIEAGSTESNEISIGNHVALKTLGIELGKRRSFLQAETNQSGALKKINSTNALLSFISPIMLVTDIKPFDVKKIEKGTTTKKHKKIYPQNLVKCKWFDAIAEKWSELLMPQDALIILPEVNDKLIARMVESISNKTFLNLNGILYKPTQLSNRSGTYFVSGFNYISQQEHSFNLNEISSIKKIDLLYLAHAPFYTLRKKKGSKVLKLIKSNFELIKKAIERKKKNYLTLKYKDKWDNITVRTVSDYELILGDNILDIGGDMIYYLKAYCHFRDATRHFKLDGILEIQELNLRIIK
ncbi:uncharacterized protein YodC (DUF2158 family) [Mucilaginibacter sp. UYP25]|uniref:WYL domain-containing protein n=1 Tax=unclassified Mucilaginibacter TaxID=2617802 RepID=UPI00339938D4